MVLYDFNEIFRRGRIIDRRLYDTLEDLYSKIGAGGSGEAPIVKIVEVAASGDVPLVSEIKTAFGTTSKPFSGVVKDTTNNKNYFVVFDGSKCEKVEV